MKKTSKKPISTAEWMRGYKRHTLWIGDRKKAEILLKTSDSGQVEYAWRCIDANMAGVVQSLELAKSTAQSIVFSKITQLDLFLIDTK